MNPGFIVKTDDQLTILESAKCMTRRGILFRKKGKEEKEVRKQMGLWEKPGTLLRIRKGTKTKGD
jgi:hypothetical protein